MVFIPTLAKMSLPVTEIARFRTSCVAAVFDSGFNQHEGVNHVFAAVVHRLAAADGERVAVVTGQLTCLPEFSWDQSGIQLTEATCSGGKKKNPSFFSSFTRRSCPALPCRAAQ